MLSQAVNELAEAKALVERLTLDICRLKAAINAGVLYHFDQFGQRLGFFIFREIPENLKIFETFKSVVRKNQVGQGTAELNEMVQWDLPVRHHSAVMCYACTFLSSIHYVPWSQRPARDTGPTPVVAYVAFYFFLVML